MKPLNILIIGGATKDIFINYEDSEILILPKNDKTFIMLEEGSKINVKELSYHSGGGASNCAVSFKKLNFNVSIFCKLGKDIESDFILKDLKKENINIFNIVYSDSKTAISFILPTPSGDRIVLAFRGTNSEIDKKEIPISEIKNSDFIYITPLSGKSTEILLPILNLTQQNNIKVAINPSSTQLKSKEFIKAIENTYILLLNKIEAKELMLNLNNNFTNLDKENSKLSPKLLNHFMTYKENNISIKEFFREVLKLGPEFVVVTNGSEGVYVGNKNKIYFHKSITLNKIINTLGAGDAFSSTFTAMIINEQPIEKALLYGIINASSVISSEGAKTGLLTLKEIENIAKTVYSEIEIYDL